jgi:hypothetical protein
MVYFLTYAPPPAKAVPGIAKIKFDIRKVFVESAIPQLEDIKDITREFDFDLLICDNAFTGYTYRVCL